MSYRIVSLNLCAYFGRSRIADLARLVAEQAPDVVLLQECRRKWLGVVCEAAGLEGVHAREVPPELPRWPQDGCAIAVRAPLRVVDAWRVQPAAFQPAAVQAVVDEATPATFEVLPERLGYRYSARNVIAGIEGPNTRFVVASLHATPGTGGAALHGRRVSEWKPFFHGALAIALTELTEPFVFAIDANEPLAETLTEIRFHWASGRSGVRKFEALLGLTPMHRARDLIREACVTGARSAATSEHLAHTYTTRGGGKRHFDHVWATPEFRASSIQIYYEDACSAGTDHAMIVTDVDLTM